VGFWFLRRRQKRHSGMNEYRPADQDGTVADLQHRRQMKAEGQHVPGAGYDMTHQGWRGRSQELPAESTPAELDGNSRAVELDTVNSSPRRNS
jgi:hypothetical protein